MVLREGGVWDPLTLMTFFMLGGQMRIHMSNTVLIIKCLVLDGQMDTWMKIPNRKKEIMQMTSYITPSHMGGM